MLADTMRDKPMADALSANEPIETITYSDERET